MRRFSLVLLPIVVLSIFALLNIPSAPAAVHTIAPRYTVDADMSDWHGTAGDLNGSITYDAHELIFKDPPGDERTDFANPDPNVDIEEFRIAYEGSYLYFLVKFVNIQTDSGVGAPLVDIAIDTVPGSGLQWFAGYAGVNVAPEAAWEYQIKTTFVSSTTDTPKVYGPTGSEVTVDVSAAINKSTDVVEVRINIADIGLPADLPFKINVSVAVGRSDGNVDPNMQDPGTSQRVLDVVFSVSSGDINTWNLISDSLCEYYIEVSFQPDHTIPLSNIYYHEPMYIKNGLYNVTQNVMFTNDTFFSNVTFFVNGSSSMYSDRSWPIQVYGGSTNITHCNITDPSGEVEISGILIITNGSVYIEGVYNKSLGTYGIVNVSGTFPSSLEIYNVSFDAYAFFIEHSNTVPLSYVIIGNITSYTIELNSSAIMFIYTDRVNITSSDEKSITGFINSTNVDISGTLAVIINPDTEEDPNTGSLLIHDTNITFFLDDAGFGYTIQIKDSVVANIIEGLSVTLISSTANVTYGNITTLTAMSSNVVIENSTVENIYAQSGSSVNITNANVSGTLYVDNSHVIVNGSPVPFPSEPVNWVGELITQWNAIVDLSYVMISNASMLFGEVNGYYVGLAGSWTLGSNVKVILNVTGGNGNLTLGGYADATFYNVLFMANITLSDFSKLSVYNGNISGIVIEDNAMLYAQSITTNLSEFADLSYRIEIYDNGNATFVDCEDMENVTVFSGSLLLVNTSLSSLSIVSGNVEITSNSTVDDVSFAEGTLIVRDSTITNLVITGGYVEFWNTYYENVSDTIDPSLDVSAPEDATIGTTVIIEFKNLSYNVKIDGVLAIDRIELYLNDSLVAVYTPENLTQYTFTMLGNTTGEVKVYSKFGTVVVYSFEIIVKPEEVPPPAAEAFNYILIGIIVAVVAVAAAVAIIIWRRRKLEKLVEAATEESAPTPIG